MTQKTAKKTAKPSPRSGVALPVGNHPGNTGGKKGRSGRLPDEFKSFLAQLRKSPEFQDAFARAVTDHRSPSFGVALRVLAAYDPDRPADKHQVTGPQEVTVRIVREGKRRLGETPDVRSADQSLKDVPSTIPIVGAPTIRVIREREAGRMP